MKKILLAAAAALAITSCSQNEEFENPVQKAEINFDTYVGKSLRVAEATTGTLQANGFKLYAYNTGAKEMKDVTALGSALIDDAGTYSGAWALGATYYWPIDENLQFFAYSPKTPTEWVATGQYPAFKYEVKAVASQEDLMVAVTTDKKKTASTNMGAVELLFKHILTQINFKVQGQDAGFTYKVTDITLGNVMPEGVYTYGAEKGSWVASGTATQYTYAGSALEVTDQNASSVTAGNSLMLMPQASNAITISITYSTEQAGKSIYKGTKVVTITDAKWDVGKKILYSLTLAPGGEKITVNPSIDPWETEGSGSAS